MAVLQPATEERAFAFLRLNERPAKPRTRGVTEISGPYYTPLGPCYLENVLDTAGAYVDALKFAGGSFALMPGRAVRGLIDLCHAHDVPVSTGGFIEHVWVNELAGILGWQDPHRAYLALAPERIGTSGLAPSAAG
jgi:hypothetical protein